MGKFSLKWGACGTSSPSSNDFLTQIHEATALGGTRPVSPSLSPTSKFVWSGCMICCWRCVILHACLRVSGVAWVGLSFPSPSPSLTLCSPPPHTRQSHGIVREGPGLSVREHLKSAPYVDGATLVRVHSYKQVLALIELGNRNRWD